MNWLILGSKEGRALLILIYLRVFFPHSETISSIVNRLGEKMSIDCYYPPHEVTMHYMNNTKWDCLFSYKTWPVMTHSDISSPNNSGSTSRVICLPFKQWFIHFVWIRFLSAFIPKTSSRLTLSVYFHSKWESGCAEHFTQCIASNHYCIH